GDALVADRVFIPEPDATIAIDAGRVAADAGRDVLRPEDAGGDGGCNSVPQLGALVTPVCDPGPPPVPQGGTIVDGLYVLQRVTLYEPCLEDGVPFAETVLFSGNTVQAVGEVADFQSIMRDNGTYTVSGATFTEILDCPGSGTEVDGFDATPTSLTIYSSG